MTNPSNPPRKLYRVTHLDLSGSVYVWASTRGNAKGKVSSAFGRSEVKFDRFISAKLVPSGIIPAEEGAQRINEDMVRFPASDTSPTQANRQVWPGPLGPGIRADLTQGVAPEANLEVEFKAEPEPFINSLDDVPMFMRPKPQPVQQPEKKIGCGEIVLALAVVVVLVFAAIVIGVGR